jgi:hypothetical protein
VSFDFYLQILTETFLIVRRIERDITINVQGLHIKYPTFLTDFNETRLFSTDFQKLLKYQISLKSVHYEQSCSVRKIGHRQTDRMQLTLA